MARHNDTGQQGEQIAAKHLTEKGYQILEQNWRHKRAEVDLICKLGDKLVFVEVKTLTSNAFGYPENSVGAKKERMLSEAADEYVHQTNHQQEVRFDIVAITLQPQVAIEHFEDAFFPS